MSSGTIVLVDTSVWIDFFARRPGPAGTGLADLIARGARCAICGPVLAEILQGVRDPRAHSRIASTLDAFEYLEDRGRDTWLASADAYRACRARGVTPRSLVDVVIACLAVAHDVDLLHFDRDFEAMAVAMPLLRARRADSLST